MISVSIQHNFPLIKEFITAVSDVAVKKAAVAAMNRAAGSVKTEGARWISKRIALPISGSKKEAGRSPPGIKSMIEISRARYNRSAPLSSVAAFVHMSNKPISLIHFIRGSKEPQIQKGLQIKDRKILTAMVRRGASVKIPKAFILKSNRGGATQVFYRRSQGTYHKQSAPSLYHWSNKPEFHKEMRKIALNRLRIEYPRQLAFYTSRILIGRKKPA